MYCFVCLFSRRIIEVTKLRTLSKKVREKESYFLIFVCGFFKASNLPIDCSPWTVPQNKKTAQGVLKWTVPLKSVDLFFEFGNGGFNCFCRIDIGGLSPRSNDFSAYFQFCRRPYSESDCICKICQRSCRIRNRDVSSSVSTLCQNLLLDDSWNFVAHCRRGNVEQVCSARRSQEFVHRFAFWESSKNFHVVGHRRKRQSFCPECCAWCKYNCEQHSQ